MNRTKKRILGAAAAVAVVGTLLAFGQSGSGRIQNVLVTNFPSKQRVHGEVSIQGPVETAVSLVGAETLVSPVRPDQTTNLIDGGVLDVGGFSQVVLSLGIESKGEMTQDGRVGAFLVPEEELVERAFREDGELLFSLEVSGRAEPGRNYFASNQPVYTLGFSRYRIYYYNSTDKSVAATLYAYLSSN